METLIALLRNGACGVKDALDGQAHWLMDPVYGEITALEAVIAPLQFAAVLYNLTAAVPYLLSMTGS